jgi:hypothetical protein
MSTLTIHAIESSVEKRIRTKAVRERKSLNQTLKELLASSVGVGLSTAADHREDFAEFCGIWTPQDAKNFAAATADLETVEKDAWR